jgi:hypothetical protein
VFLVVSTLLSNIIFSFLFNKNADILSLAMYPMNNQQMVVTKRKISMKILEKTPTTCVYVIVASLIGLYTTGSQTK